MSLQDRTSRRLPFRDAAARVCLSLDGTKLGVVYLDDPCAAELYATADRVSTADLKPIQTHRELPRGATLCASPDGASVCVLFPHRDGLMYQDLAADDPPRSWGSVGSRWQHLQAARGEPPMWAVGGFDQRKRTWQIDAMTGFDQPVPLPQELHGACHSLALSPDGRRWAVGYFGQNGVEFGDVSGARAPLPGAFQGTYHEVAFADADVLLVVSYSDIRAELAAWNLATQRPERIVSRDLGPERVTAVAADSGTMAIARGNEVEIWRFRTP